MLLNRVVRTTTVQSLDKFIFENNYSKEAHILLK